MTHHYQELEMSLNNVSLTQADLSVDEWIRAINYLICKLQQAFSNLALGFTQLDAVSV